MKTQPWSELDGKTAFLRRRPSGPHAIAELDRRYWRFVRTLPRDEALLAIDRSLFAGEGPSMPLQSVADFGFMIGFPRAFWGAFPRLEEEEMVAVEEAWLFLMLYWLLRDNVADDQVATDGPVPALVKKLLAHSRQVFRELCAERAEFWQRLAGYHRRTEDALRLEAYYRAHPEAYTDLADARAIGIGKSALYKSVPCAMAAHCDDFASLPRLEHSMDCLAAGRQMFDDVNDWDEDLVRGHYTYPLAQAILSLQNQGLPATPAAVRTAVQETKILEEMMRQAAGWHEEALAAVEGIPVDGWRGLVNGSLGECLMATPSGRGKRTALSPIPVERNTHG